MKNSKVVGGMEVGRARDGDRTQERSRQDGSWLEVGNSQDGGGMETG